MKSFFQKSKNQILILTLLLGFTTTGYAQVSNFSFKRVGIAKTWDDARKQCQDQGWGWDLPTSEQLPLVLQKELAVPLKYYEAGVSYLKHDYVLWVRSDREEYNVQLQGHSIALRYHAINEEISEFDLSPEAFAELDLLKKQIMAVQPEQVRSAQEQALYEQAVSSFEQLYPFANIRFEMDQPYPLNHPLLSMLPEGIFSLEVKIAMTKHNPEYLKTMEKNITLLLHDFEQGLSVTCMTDISQFPGGNQKP